jgi:hypothetical protein
VRPASTTTWLVPLRRRFRVLKGVFVSTVPGFVRDQLDGFPRITWFRRDFLMRRRLDRLFLDGPDWIVRRLSARGHWPPYSLRVFVGGAERFDEVGRWFLQELLSLGLLAPGVRILDVGCGCGSAGISNCSGSADARLASRILGNGDRSAQCRVVPTAHHTAKPTLQILSRGLPQPLLQPEGDDCDD